jgi:anaerobic C4-dicarboxylate transporter
MNQAMAISQMVPMMVDDMLCMLTLLLFFLSLYICSSLETEHNCISVALRIKLEDFAFLVMLAHFNEFFV